MSKINKILLVVVVILIIALAGVIYWQKGGFEERYWAVYLSSGDLYFGQLERFPQLAMTDVWFLQRNAQDEQNPFSLAKLDKAFWGPEDKIYFDEKDVIWKTELKSDSPVLQTIKNPQSAQQSSSQTQLSPVNDNSSSTER